MNKLLLTLLVVGLAGCSNTGRGVMQGAGKDIQSWGKSLTDAFDPSKQEKESDIKVGQTKLGPVTIQKLDK